MKMWFEATHHQMERSGKNRKTDPSAGIGCITNWGAHGLLKRGLRRWGSTGSWVCLSLLNFVIDEFDDVKIGKKETKLFLERQFSSLDNFILLNIQLQYSIFVYSVGQLLSFVK